MCSPPAQSYTFLISSDYERAEWRENIREQQKKCEWPVRSGRGLRSVRAGRSPPMVSNLVFPKGQWNSYPSEMCSGALKREIMGEGLS